MTTDKFFKKMMEEEYPNAGFFRRWFQKTMYKIWLKQATGRRDGETNRDFINQIPNND